jgi:hypothetical protein
MIETMQISSVSCPECGASTMGLTPLFHHPFCQRLFKAGTDADLIAKLQAENAALRADLEGVRLINKLQAEALAEERDLTRRYKSEIAALLAEGK